MYEYKQYENAQNMNHIILDDSIDIAIFSPPYVNCFDYFEVYKIELWLGGFVKSYDSLRKMRKSALTSNLNAIQNHTSNQKVHSQLYEHSTSMINQSELWDKRIIKMLYLYFLEMEEIVLKLKHIILSHQGSLQNGTPVPPRFPEALFIHLLDTFDGKMDIMQREIDNDPNQHWTDKHNHFYRELWKK